MGKKAIRSNHIALRLFYPGEIDPQATSPHQDLPRLSAAFRLAEEMGAQLGVRPVLQREMPSRTQSRQQDRFLISRQPPWLAAAFGIYLFYQLAADA